MTFDGHPHRCARGGTELAVSALACPSCSTLVHRERLQELAALAAAAESEGARETARAHWHEAQSLLPVDSAQFERIGAKLAALGSPATRQPSAGTESKTKWGAIVGGGATIALLLGSKLKFLLLGLSKASTLLSMFGFIGVYWTLYGWPLAVGMGVSIYIHEMGHVAMLTRLGIQSGAPLFIPGFGAIVMLRQHITDPIVDARIGLAGPVWGLGAGIAAWIVYAVTDARIWLAIAELTAFLNLFNLTPVWQLDGARGFHALSRPERWAIVALIALMLWATGVRMLWIVGAVAVYRAFAGQAGPGHTPTLVTFAILVLALSWLSRAVG
jgi:Zn-dependent protease